MTEDTERRIVALLEEIAVHLEGLPDIGRELTTMNQKLDRLQETLGGELASGEVAPAIAPTLEWIQQMVLEMKVSMGGYMSDGEYQPSASEVLGEELGPKLDAIQASLEDTNAILGTIDCTLSMKP